MDSFVKDLIHPMVLNLEPYLPGKSIAEIQEKYQISEVIKLASNENCLGCSPKVLDYFHGISMQDIHLYPAVYMHPLHQHLASFLNIDPHEYHVKLNGNIIDILNEIGHMPLPPYITRPDDNNDKQHYQTIFAQHEGSVAAPTAGLHFDDMILKRLAAKGIDIAAVTLHVGAGTFQPVRVDDIRDHIMHDEWYCVSDALIAKIKAAKRVIAIGTTSLRALESAARDDFKTKIGLTNLFITPGYQFKVIDGLMTNFHLPESSLLMLVAALIGHAELMRVYEEALRLRYRFFSYGDACLFL